MVENGVAMKRIGGSMAKAVSGIVALRGFDCNTEISVADAHLFWCAGYRFAIRYLPRIIVHKNDLSRGELFRLYTHGLAVMGVQHVESESSWVPTLEKGMAYGHTAVAHAD